jgi:hypothetical protein
LFNSLSGLTLGGGILMAHPERLEMHVSSGSAFSRLGPELAREICSATRTTQALSVQIRDAPSLMHEVFPETFRIFVNTHNSPGLKNPGSPPGKCEMIPSVRHNTAEAMA